jgi:hypothetical protein
MIPSSRPYGPGPNGPGPWQAADGMKVKAGAQGARFDRSGYGVVVLNVNVSVFA